MRTLLLLLFLGMSSLFVSSQQTYLQADHMRSRTELYSSLIKTLKVSNDEASSHVQGIAVDIENGYIYFSFTTKLIQTDLYGRILGSVFLTPKR